MPIRFPCGICGTAVAKTHRAVFCDVCEHWVHIKCNNITFSQYCILVEDDTESSWCCHSCFNSALPFSFIDNDNFLLTNVAGKNPEISELENIDCNVGGRNKELINEISNMILQNQNLNPDETEFNCGYYDIEKIIKSKFVSNNFFSIIHHNIHSLQSHFEELKYLLQCVSIEFDVIALSECKLYKNTIPLIDINLPQYDLEYTPTEASKGGTALYISKKHKYIPRTD